MAAKSDVRQAVLTGASAEPVVLPKPLACALLADTESSQATRRVRIALVLGAALGLGVAVATILQPRESGAIPRDAIATVNGTPILGEEFERAVNALSSDRRFPIGEEEKRLVLDRLVDEELLVQRARELGLDRNDRGVRSRLVSAMMEAVLAEQAGNTFSDAEAEAFYRDNAGFFASEERIWVRDLRIAITQARPEAEARARAELAASRLRAGEGFATVSKDLGDATAAALPDGPLPASALREYLGPTLAARALELHAGEVTAPERDRSGFHVLQSVAREPGTAPALSEVQQQVRAEMRRRADDRALRAYLDRLRAEATVRMRTR